METGLIGKGLIIRQQLKTELETSMTRDKKLSSTISV